MADAVRRDIRDAYAGGAASWVTGPERVYRRLAEALADCAPEPLDGRSVLDLGSGTGVASAVVQERGARPVGYDLAWEMLRQHGASRPPGVAGDAHHLPFAAASFDAVVAACCLNHFVPDEPLAECRRVLRRGGFVVASTFPADRPHPVKELIEPVLVTHGWQPPPWYAEFRTSIAAVTGDGEALTAAARRAGFAMASAEVVDVETGLDDRGFVDWRLSMPHTIGFVEGLDSGARDALVTDLTQTVEGRALPTTLALLVLTASG